MALFNFGKKKEEEKKAPAKKKNITQWLACGLHTDSYRFCL